MIISWKTIFSPPIVLLEKIRKKKSFVLQNKLNIHYIILCEHKLEDQLYETQELETDQGNYINRKEGSD